MACWTTSTESGGTKDSLGSEGKKSVRLIILDINHTTKPVPRFMNGSRPSCDTKLNVKEVLQWLLTVVIILEENLILVDNKIPWDRFVMGLSNLILYYGPTNIGFFQPIQISVFESLKSVNTSISYEFLRFFENCGQVWAFYGWKIKLSLFSGWQTV